MKLKHYLPLAMAVALSFPISNMNAKPNPKIDSPVQEALKDLPKVAAAAIDPGNDHLALERHLSRIGKAPNAEAEASEIEALKAWLEKNKVAEFFIVSLGHRCPELTDEELLALSSWPNCKLMLAGGVRAPVIMHAEINFKDPKNLLRLIPLAPPAQEGSPQ